MSDIQWFKVLDSADELPENRVKTVTARQHDLCLTHYDGQINALDNKCPHQGGPLGEGSIENGLLRCPWHGWDYHPCTGKAPGFDDGVQTYPVEVREDGVYVGMEPAPEHVPTISDVMVETMVNWGLDTVFGMVGHSNLGLADALRRKEESGDLTYVAIRHEGAGAFAASAYGKLTGRPAACFSIAGPGATNMYTGLWDANVDRAPILALTGQVATQVVGTGNFQELDLVQAFSSVAGFNHRVLSSSKHAELVSLAMKHAIINRGVSHLTFPDEVQPTPMPEGKAQSPVGRVGAMEIRPPAESLEAALQAIRQAKRPVIITGHGARFDMPAVIQLAERLNAPVLTTFKGKGQISDLHPLAGGVLGRSGTPIASWLMNEADLLIVFGASFSNHTGISYKIPTIQVDIDPMALSKFHKIDVPVWGEISVTLEMMKQQLEGQDLQAEDQRPDVAKRWKIWREEKQRRLKEYRGKGAGAIHIFDAMNRLAPEDAVMCVDVGNNAYSFGRYFESKAHSFLMSGYLGSIGFALPASIGAWAAVKDSRPVVAVAGDGGFGQYMADFTTLVRHQMPVKVILLNNNELGKISKEQRGVDLQVWQTAMVNPDFAAYAQSCGAWGKRITSPEEIESAMTELFEQEGPGLLEISQDVTLL